MGIPSESENSQASNNNDDHHHHHVVIFPHLAQGHTLPLIDLSKAITLFGLRVTIITTPKNAPHIQPKIAHYPNISLAILPFNAKSSADDDHNGIDNGDSNDIPQGCENTAHLPSTDLLLPFVASIKKTLRKPFQDFLTNMSDQGRPPLCVISDFFLGWTVDVCDSFGIPRIVFSGMGVLTMAIIKAVHKDVSKVMSFPDDHPITSLLPTPVPFSLYKSDFPTFEAFKSEQADEWLKLLAEIGDTESRSWGVLANSFEELEGDYVNFLESYHKGQVWCVGPGLMWDTNNNNNLSNDRPYYIDWLETTRLKSNDTTRRVIYVSFGTQSHMSDAQMDEVARGLETAGHPFIWVVRSPTWECSDKGWEKRVDGLVVREWVDQRVILSHPSVHGFLSHCGWNSVLESLSFGVPILAWPMGNDQPVNAKVAANGFGAGIVLVDGIRGMIVEGEVISEGIKELMEGDEGKKARDRAIEIGKKAKEAVRVGNNGPNGNGSSYSKLGQMIELLIKMSNNDCNNK